MNIVLDANIVIAALMGSRGTLTILTSRNHHFYAPSRILAEIWKYKKDICEKSCRTSEEFDDNFAALLVFVDVLNYIEYEQFMEEARIAISARDWKDADYIACAIAVSANFIWTNDKDFSSQNIVLARTTQEFIDEDK